MMLYVLGPSTRFIHTLTASLHQTSCCTASHELCLCRHVRLGWKPVTAPEHPGVPNDMIGITQNSSTMDIDDSSHPEASHTLKTGPKLGPLPEDDLSRSVMVTTYNRTPYFYEGVDPNLTPESRFPTDKLKMQVVVEAEEEEEIFQPRPQKVKLIQNHPKFMSLLTHEC